MLNLLYKYSIASFLAVIGSGLNLYPDDGKVTRWGIQRELGLIKHWDTSAEIFWDLELANPGFLEINFMISDAKERKYFQLTLGDCETNTNITMEKDTTIADSVPKLMPMGRFEVQHGGKYQISISSPYTSQITGDLHWVALTGTASKDAKVIVFPYNSIDTTVLSYEHRGNVTMFYNSVIVNESFAATRFCATGFHNGCLGTSEANYVGDKDVFFFIDTPTKYAVKVVKKGKGIHPICLPQLCTMKFDVRWDIEEKVHFLLKVEEAPEGYVQYTGFVYLPDEKNWKLIAILKTKDNSPKVYTSFVEEGRKGYSHVARSASFDPWYKRSNGKWVQFKTAHFKKIGTNANINAKVLNGGRFFMETGGDTVRENPFHHQLQRNVHDDLPGVLKNIDEIINEHKYLP